MSIVEMRMLRWISENIRKNMIWNEKIHLKIRVTLIDENMRESHLRWFCHIQRRAINIPMRKQMSLYIQVERMEKKVEEDKNKINRSS